MRTSIKLRTNIKYKGLALLAQACFNHLLIIIHFQIPENTQSFQEPDGRNLDIYMYFPTFWCNFLNQDIQLPDDHLKLRTKGQRSQLNEIIRILRQ